MKRTETDRCLSCGQSFRVPAGHIGAVACPHCGGKPLNVLIGEAEEDKGDAHGNDRS